MAEEDAIPGYAGVVHASAAKLLAATTAFNQDTLPNKKHVPRPHRFSLGMETRVAAMRRRKKAQAGGGEAFKQPLSEEYMEGYTRIVHGVMEKLTSAPGKRVARSVLAALKKKERKNRKKAGAGDSTPPHQPHDDSFTDGLSPQEEIPTEPATMPTTLYTDAAAALVGGGLVGGTPFPGSLLSRVSAERAAVLLILEAELRGRDAGLEDGTRRVRSASQGRVRLGRDEALVLAILRRPALGWVARMALLSDVCRGVVSSHVFVWLHW